MMFTRTIDIEPANILDTCQHWYFPVEAPRTLSNVIREVIPADFSRRVGVRVDRGSIAKLVMRLVGNLTPETKTEMVSTRTEIMYALDDWAKKSYNWRYSVEVSLNSDGTGRILHIRQR